MLIKAMRADPAGNEAVTEVTSDAPLVLVGISAGPCETFDDKDLTRWLSPGEARELAAALVHHAEEAERAR